MRKLASIVVNPVVDAALAAANQASLWNLYSRSVPGTYMHRRLRDHFMKNESKLPEPVRAAFADHKWNSQWFFDAWFSKALSLDHVEARFRLLRQIRLSDLQFDAIDDLGTANGTFLRDCTNVFPTLDAYRGWEISQKAVDALKKKYDDDSRIQFFRTEVLALVEAPLTSILTTSGTLQYMPEAELKDFLTSYAARPRAIIGLSEISNFGLLPVQASTYRAHETYNHDYQRMLRNAGFRIISSEEFSYVQNVTWVIVLATKERDSQ